ncbi:hypothetical protein [Phenylobacterium sp.]|uniref:hypothetical protein n=1 Tax=Phenylobacterium sp. TaxID=1871053 RepID=UPI002737905B|nr:hypothetical protein [Phenylobacterium sp.]MDP3869903.1 hypothetical protein [Phenylobacterium sp.]
MSSKPRYDSSEHAGRVLGFRSGLEVSVSTQLRGQGVEFRYEELKIKYVVPSRLATYTPDFILPNGIIVETKGRYEADDREKHLLVRAQHPDLDIRLVFSRSSTPIRTGSPTTYRVWCDTHGFQFADKLIPTAWLLEPPSATRLDAIKRATTAPNQEEWSCFKLARKRT